MMRSFLTLVFAFVTCGLLAAKPERPPQPEAPDPFEAQVEKSLKAQGGYVNRDEKAPGKPITEIINVRDISDAELVSLAKLNHLRQLQLVGAGDDKVKLATELTQLRSFCISSETFTNAGLAELNRLPLLENVMVQGGRVTHEGIKTLTASKRLKHLGLQSVALGDTGMKHLAAFKELRSVYLNDTHVTGEQLSSLKHVETLFLYREPLTPAGIKELGKLTSLRSLSIAHQFTDAHMKDIAGLIKLETLVLQQNPGITDASLKSMIEMENLEDLWLSDTQVTGVGFKHLAGLKKLRGIYLYSTPTNDAGLKEIAQIKGLQKLWLSETKITDAGLKELHGLTDLTQLVIANTPLSGNAIDAFQKAVPKCQILGAGTGRLAQ